MDYEKFILSVSEEQKEYFKSILSNTESPKKESSRSTETTTPGKSDRLDISELQTEKHSKSSKELGEAENDSEDIKFYESVNSDDTGLGEENRTGQTKRITSEPKLLKSLVSSYDTTKIEKDTSDYSKTN